MMTGVHCTVVMDCCHSGTVLDLPYTFGADDKEMSREAGFNMDIVRDGEQARREKEQDEAAGNSPRKEKTPKSPRKDDQKKSKKDSSDGKKNKKRKEDEDEDEIEVGPQTDASGVPQLPIRKAAPREKAKKPPPKKWQFWRK